MVQKREQGKKSENTQAQDALRVWLVGLAGLKGGLRTRLGNGQADGNSGKSSKSPTDHVTIDETDRTPGSERCASTPNSKT